jgi:hypothetical protein
MITISERAVTIAIWLLTACGGFFGGRAVLRRRRKQRDGQEKKGPT